MPYALKKKGNKWVVIKKDTGKVVAGNKTPLTHEQAVKSMRARYAAHEGTLDSQKKK